MTLPPQNDDPRPVVLQEPERDLAPGWQPSGNKGFVLPFEDSSAENLHPGWAQVLAQGESVLWQAAATPDLRLSGIKRMMPLLPFALFGAFVALNIGVDPGFVIFGLVALFVFGHREMRNTKSGIVSDRRYLLTNRAAYLARAEGSALFDIQAFPITQNMRLGLGPRSVAFTTRRNAKGEEEAEGFLDINDAAAVHAKIKDIQKALP